MKEERSNNSATETSSLRIRSAKNIRIHHHTEHAFSPFVVALNPLPEPQTILEDKKHTPVIRIDFLKAEPITFEVPAIPTQDNELTLEQVEVEIQLQEVAPKPKNHRSWAKPSHAEPVTFSEQKTPLDTPSLPFSQTFSTKDFVPTSEPLESFEDYFFFPDAEDDDQDESDVLMLEDLEEAAFALEIEPHSSSAPRRRIIFWFALEGWHRSMAAFLIAAIAIILPLQGLNITQKLLKAKTVLEDSGKTAVSHLEAGAGAAFARNAHAAADSFSQANQQFSRAQSTIDKLGATTSILLSTLPATKKSYETGENLIKAGDALSFAGERLAEGFIAMEQDVNPTPTSRLNILNTYVTSAVPYLKTAEAALAEVDPSHVPTEQRAALAELQTQLPLLMNSLEEFLKFSEMGLTILGDKGSKRYLLVFQNNTELRATGGFMGSFAEITVADGEITQLSIPKGGTYDLQGSLRQNIISPKPLQLLKARWEFQDANWFADFPTSAKQTLELYENAGGPTVDGVIAINATYVADLIGLLGPIEMPEYGRTITAQNFIPETQKIVEIEYDRTANTPKAFIGDLAPKLLDRTLEKTAEDFLGIVDHLNEGLVRRDIQLFFQDNDLQKEILKHGWGGAVEWTEGDYLMVVNSNIGGGKTDGVMKEHVQMDVWISETGKATNTVTITRTHYGQKGDLFYGENNVNFLRLYTPKGSKLIEASGFTPPDEELFDLPRQDWKLDDDLLYSLENETIEPASGTAIYEESGKTVFGNWVQTKPGTTSKTTFTYELPFDYTGLLEDKGRLDSLKLALGFPDTARYSLLIQHQSGVLDRKTTINFHLPDSLKSTWSSHNLTGTTFENADGLFATLLEPNTP